MRRPLGHLWEDSPSGSVGMLWVQGQLVSEGAGLPVHVAGLPKPALFWRQYSLFASCTELIRLLEGRGRPGLPVVLCPPGSRWPVQRLPAQSQHCMPDQRQLCAEPLRFVCTVLCRAPEAESTAGARARSCSWAGKPAWHLGVHLAETPPTLCRGQPGSWLNPSGFTNLTGSGRMLSRISRLCFPPLPWWQRVDCTRVGPRLWPASSGYLPLYRDMHSNIINSSTNNINFQYSSRSLCVVLVILIGWWASQSP